MKELSTLTTDCPLTSSELSSLISLLPYASEQELTAIRRLLPAMGTGRTTATIDYWRQKNLENYYPHQLSHRQKVFLGLDSREALYGGAAGGGKSDALLAAAVEYVHVPGYRAIILRRTKPNLVDLIERTHEWWNGKAEYVGSPKPTWRFPGGGTVYLDSMNHENDKYNLKGPAFQFVGFDEVSEFTEGQYTYALSRVRGPENPDVLLSHVPWRGWATTNPDGPGREWVKNRFVSDKAAEEVASGDFKDVYYNELKDEHGNHIATIPFVPSLAKDNPGINAEKYVRDSLSRLDPVTRDRLKRGDWIIREGGKIPASSLRYYTMRGDHLVPLEEGGESRITIDCRQCFRFATIDTAGTSKEEAEEKKGRAPSYSVVAIWDYWRAADLLFLRHVWRDRVGWNDLKSMARAVVKQWGSPRSFIENAKNGPELAAEMKAVGLHTELIPTVLPGMDSYRGAKLERAITSGLLTRCGEGKLLLPTVPGPPWLKPYVNEITGWTGLPDEPFDQGDVTSHAAYKCKQSGSGNWAVIKTKGMDRR